MFFAITLEPYQHCSYPNNLHPSRNTSHSKFNNLWKDSILGLHPCATNLAY
jgi:hypothetical protein